VSARARAAAWLLGPLLALLAACDDGLAPGGDPTASVAPGPAPDRGARPSPGATIRLWRDLVPIEEHHPAPADDPGEVWASRRFDGSPSSIPLWRVVDTGTHVVHEAYEPAGDGWVLLNADFGFGVLAVVDVRPGEAIDLQVRARVVGEPLAEPVPVAVAIERREPFDPDVPLDAEDVARLFDARGTRHHELVAPLTGETRTLHETFVLEPRTRQLAIYALAPLHAPRSAVALREITLRRRGLSDHVALGGRVPGLEPLPVVPPDGPAPATRSLPARSPSAVRVTLDGDVREALLALAPSRFVYELPPCRDERRLQLSLGVRPRDGRIEGAVRFTVALGDRVLLDETLTAPSSGAEPAWHDRDLALAPGPAPARLLLATAPAGGEPPLAVLGHPTVRTPGADPRPNLVLISLDTLRPDRLGCYGGDPRISRHIDALAADGLRYDSAFSTSSYTLPSHASLMTGQFPAIHGAVDIADPIDTEHSPLLARALADAGYVTAAFTAGGYVDADFGFAEGFDRYSENDPVWAYDTVRGRLLVESASRRGAFIDMDRLRRYGTPMITGWIARQPPGSPFLLFVHTYIAHNYAPDERWLEAFGLLGEDGRGEPFDHKPRTRFNEGELSLREEVYEAYMPYYDATIGMADEFVGAVAAALEEAGLYEDTMIVVTSDHGEEFGEHDFFGHGETVFASNTRVPLIVKPAGTGGPRGVVSEPVSLVDVAPWMLRAAGLEPDPRMTTSPALAPDRVDPPARERLFVELDTRRNRVSAVREGDHELHVAFEQDGEALSEPEVSLYDVARDPGQTRDLAPEAPARVRALRALLHDYHSLAEAARPPRTARDPDALDPETRARLQALGYAVGQ